MKENVKALVEAVKGLSEDDQREFDYETFNDFSYNLGVDDGRKRVAVEQLLLLIEQSGDLEVLDEVYDEVMDTLQGEEQPQRDERELEYDPAVAKAETTEDNN